MNGHTPCGCDVCIETRRIKRLHNYYPASFKNLPEEPDSAASPYDQEPYVLPEWVVWFAFVCLGIVLGGVIP